MLNRKKRPATPGGRAAEFLRELAENHRRNGIRRLPTLNQLALQAGTSRSAMWRAVAHLRDCGTLLTRRGSAIELASVPGPASSLARGAKWETVRERLARDVRLGRYAPGTLLPNPKELAEAYGVSYRTLHKATEALAGVQLLSRYRSRYRVPFAGGGVRYNGSLVLIARGTPDAGPVAVGPNTIDLLRLFESACARARLALEFMPYDYVRGSLCPTRESRALVRGGLERPLGFVVLATGVQDPDPLRPDNLLGLAPALTRYAVPIVFISEGGERLEAVSAQLGARLTVVSTSNSPTAGRRVAQRLLSLGHRHIAYISAHHESVWSKNRCAGLAATVAHHAGGRVTTFTRGDVLDASHLRPLRDRIGEAHARLTDHALGSGNAEERLVGTVMRTRGDSTGERAIREVIRGALLPLLDAAAERDDISAWVCANDTEALAALDYLSERRREVPSQVSVVGFDDSPEALSRRLTSYNFDCAGTVHVALHYALGSYAQARGKTAHSEDIEGYLVERRTTAAARTVPSSTREGPKRR
jgi:DNA-binding LacI/PurR family transcriptional regulator/DNA-binding transcriptional regulator YhcF (GntR family)